MALAVDIKTYGHYIGGAWIEPDPAPDLPVEEVDLSGTPADPAAIRRFLSNFHLCD